MPWARRGKKPRSLVLILARLAGAGQRQVRERPGGQALGQAWHGHGSERRRTRHNPPTPRLGALRDQREHLRRDVLCRGEVQLNTSRKPVVNLVVNPVVNSEVL